MEVPRRRKGEAMRELLSLNFMCMAGTKRGGNLCVSSEDVSNLTVEPPFYNLREREREEVSVSWALYFPLPSSASRVKAVMTWPRSLEVLQMSAVERMKKQNERNEEKKKSSFHNMEVTPRKVNRLWHKLLFSFEVCGDEEVIFKTDLA